MNLLKSFFFFGGDEGNHLTMTLCNSLFHLPLNVFWNSSFLNALTRRHRKGVDFQKECFLWYFKHILKNGFVFKSLFLELLTTFSLF